MATCRVPPPGCVSMDPCFTAHESRFAGASSAGAALCETASKQA
jgi:hypothetical protein